MAAGTVDSGYKRRPERWGERMTPSRRDKGTQIDEERFLRGTCSLVQDAGMKLGFPQWAISKAMFLCQRYFMHRSVKKNDRFLIACACLFLGGKIEESPRPPKEIIIAAWELRAKDNPKKLAKLEDQDFIEMLRDHTIQAERALISTIGFDFDISLPYNSMLNLMKKLGLVDKKHQGVTQLAWNLLNDCFRSTVCVRYPPESLATAAISIATYVHDINIDHDKIWEDTERLRSDELIVEIFELYDRSHLDSSINTNVKRQQTEDKENTKNQSDRAS